MPSADFCTAIGSPHGSPSPESRTRHRPPRLSLPTFVARPPDLQPGPSMDGGLRRVLSARPTRTAYYPIPVRRAAILLHAAFRPHVTVTPLRFANPSPPSRWIRDLHPILFGTIVAHVDLGSNGRVDCVRREGDGCDQPGRESRGVGLAAENCAAAIGDRPAGAQSGLASHAACSLSFAKWASSSSSSARPVK